MNIKHSSFSPDLRISYLCSELWVPTDFSVIGTEGFSIMVSLILLEKQRKCVGEKSKLVTLPDAVDGCFY